MSTNGVTVGTLADKHFRRPRCIAAGCKLPAVDGLSYCSEDHYEELVEERPDCRCGHPADAHVRGHHGDSDCKRPFCSCGNYDTRAASGFISEQAAAAIIGSLQPEPANPYDLVIADMEKRRDHLLDAIRLMQALRDSGV